MTMKASLIVEARDRGASSVFERLGRKVRETSSRFRPLIQNADGSDRAITRLGRNAVGSFNRIAAAARRAAGPLGLKAMEKAAYGAGYAIGWTAKKIGGMVLEAGRWAALTAGVGAGGLIAGVISTTSKFEQFAIVLENTEGSAEAARRSLAWVQDFAKRTPYELDQVMEAYVALRAYGIDPTAGALTALGDTAAGMNKPLMQSVEMMADAMTGEFERLKDFGIRAKVQGDQVTFSYRKNGRELTRVARNNASEIQASLQSIMGDRFGGMMARQSQTLAGIWSNITGYATEFMLKIGQAGVFDRLKAKAEVFLAQLDTWAKDGTIDAFAKTISDNMGEAFDWAERLITETDWRQFGKDLRTVASAGKDIVSGIASAVIWVQRLRGALDQLNSWSPAGGLRFLTNPSPFGPGVGLFNQARDYFSPAAPASSAGGRAPGTANRPSGWSLQPRSAPPMRPAGAGRGPIGRQAVNVGGRVDVRVSAAPGLSVSTSTRSDNPRVPIAPRGPVAPGA